MTLLSPDPVSILGTIVRDASLSPQARLVYLDLFIRLQDGGLRVSHSGLAAELGYSVSGVKRALKDLRDAGLVQWAEERGEDGGRLCNRYVLL